MNHKAMAHNIIPSFNINNQTRRMCRRFRVIPSTLLSAHPQCRLA